VLPYNANLKEPSRQLRENMTNAEKRLWTKINKKQINSYQFFRQKLIGAYIVDFFCPRAQLVIEVDGGPHFTKETRENDRVRDEYLKSLGLNVLRLSNSEVFVNIEGVVERIKDKIPLGPPLRKGERAVLSVFSNVLL
jgi:very-short-patch-repair endonuclease